MNETPILKAENLHFSYDNGDSHTSARIPIVSLILLGIA